MCIESLKKKKICALRSKLWDPKKAQNTIKVLRNLSIVAGHVQIQLHYHVDWRIIQELWVSIFLPTIFVSLTDQSIVNMGHFSL